MNQQKTSYCYLVASDEKGTLYVGVTTDLVQRAHQHKTETFTGFTAQYDVKKLMWFEAHSSLESALQREKQIKKWNRAWKINLIQDTNPNWDDLYPALVGLQGAVDSRLRGNDDLFNKVLTN